LSEVGHTEDTYKTLSAPDRIGFRNGYLKAQGAKELMARMRAYDSQAIARDQAATDEQTIGEFMKNYMTAPQPSSGDFGGEAPDAMPYQGIEGRMRWAAEQTPNFSGRHLPRAIEALAKYSQAAGKGEGAGEKPELTYLGEQKIPVVTMGRTMQIDPSYGITLRNQGAADLLTQKTEAKAVTPALIPATHPGTGEAMPGFFFDQTGKLHDLRDQMTKQIGDRLHPKTNAPAGGTSSTSPKAKSAVTPAQQAVLDDFKAGKLSRAAAKVKLQQLGLQ
jgi:hypothetical protein